MPTLVHNMLRGPKGLECGLVLGLPPDLPNFCSIITSRSDRLSRPAGSPSNIRFLSGNSIRLIARQLMHGLVGEELCNVNVCKLMANDM